MQVVGDASSPPVSYSVELSAPGKGGVIAIGRLDGAQLSDHPAGAEALRAVLKPGAKLGGRRGVLRGCMGDCKWGPKLGYRT